MPFVLVRVDDRMIHGQVVVGWASVLHPDRIILCHDEIARNQWERELYESSFIDSGIQINVFSTDELLQYLRSDAFKKERVVLLVESPADALRLIQLGVPISTLNIGGLHYRAGKKELNHYIYVDEEDIRALSQIASRGIRIEGQDVPTSRKVDVMALIERAKPTTPPRKGRET